MRIFYLNFVHSEFVHEMDPGSSKGKKVNDPSMIKSNKVNMGSEIVSKSSNRGRQRNLILGSRIDFHASGSFSAAINETPTLSADAACSSEES